MGSGGCQEESEASMFRFIKPQSRSKPLSQDQKILSLANSLLEELQKGGHEIASKETGLVYLTIWGEDGWLEIDGPICENRLELRGRMTAKIGGE